MKKSKAAKTLELRTDLAYVQLKDIDYLGSGAYSCQIIIESNGFHCNRPFSFDNDEYFVSKAWDVVKAHHDEADLMDLQADSYLRFKPFGNNTILVCGYIVEDTNVTQSMEFAFSAPTDSVKNFVTEFEQMVRKNI